MVHGVPALYLTAALHECLLLERLEAVDDGGDHRGVGEGGHIAELILLARGDLAEDTAHDLARPGLGKACAQ